MPRHALRAVPWPLLAATLPVLTALLLVVRWEPYRTWPLQGIAVGLLAGIAAFAYDEPAAALVDTLPRGLAWRTAARSLGVVLLLACWCVAVAATQSAYFGHAGAVAWQGLAGTVAVVAVVSHLRRRGLASPATAVGTVVVGVTAYVALARPFEAHLPLFPYTEEDDWQLSQALWTVLAAGALCWLTLVLRQMTVRSGS